MKKSIIMAFALGALSMLSLNVFASAGEDAQAKAPIMRNIEINNEDRNINKYIEDGYDCYNDYNENDGTQRRARRGC